MMKAIRKHLLLLTISGAVVLISSVLFWMNARRIVVRTEKTKTAVLPIFDCLEQYSDPDIADVNTAPYPLGLSELDAIFQIADRLDKQPRVWCNVGGVTTYPEDLLDSLLWCSIQRQEHEIVRKILGRDVHPKAAGLYKVKSVIWLTLNRQPEMAKSLYHQISTPRDKIAADCGLAWVMKDLGEVERAEYHLNEAYTRHVAQQVEDPFLYFLALEQIYGIAVHLKDSPFLRKLCTHTHSVISARLNDPEFVSELRSHIRFLCFFLRESDDEPFKGKLPESLKRHMETYEAELLADEFRSATAEISLTPISDRVAPSLRVYLDIQILDNPAVSRFHFQAKTDLLNTLEKLTSPIEATVSLDKMLASNIFWNDITFRQAATESVLSVIRTNPDFLAQQAPIRDLAVYLFPSDPRMAKDLLAEAVHLFKDYDKVSGTTKSFRVPDSHYGLGVELHGPVFTDIGLQLCIEDYLDIGQYEDAYRLVNELSTPLAKQESQVDLLQYAWVLGDRSLTEKCLEDVCKMTVFKEAHVDDDQQVLNITAASLVVSSLRTRKWFCAFRLMELMSPSNQRYIWAFDCGRQCHLRDLLEVKSLLEKWNVNTDTKRMFQLGYASRNFCDLSFNIQQPLSAPTKKFTPPPLSRDHTYK